MATQIKPTLEFARSLYDGLVAFFPVDTLKEAGKKYQPANTWKGWAREDFEMYVRRVTVTNSVPEAAAEVKRWMYDLEHGSTPSNMPPQDLINAATEAEVAQKSGNKFETQKANKELLLKAEKHAEKVEREVFEAKPRGETPQQAPATESVQIESPQLATEGQLASDQNIFLAVTKSANKSLPGFFSRVAYSPFRAFYSAGAAEMAETNPAGATAAKLTFGQGIRSSQLKSAIDAHPNLSAGTQKRLMGLFNMMRSYEQGSQVMVALSQRRFLVQNVSFTFDLQKLGVSQAQAFSLQPTGGAFSFPQAQLSPRGVFGAMGRQLFGKVAGKALNGMLSKGLGTAASGALKALTGSNPVGLLALGAEKILGWIKNLFGGGNGQKALSYGMMLGGLLLLPFAALPGAAMLGTGGFMAAGQALGGARGLAAKGATAGQNLTYGLTALALPAIGVPLVIALVTVPLLVAFFLFIINSGAYLVPPKTVLTAGAVVSPYIGVSKTVIGESEFENTDLPLTVEYRVEIVAKKGTLTNVVVEYDCVVVQEGNEPACPPADIPEAPQEVSPSESFVFTYEHNLDIGYADSFVIDTIEVTADSPEQKGATAVGSASVKIGDPPAECPTTWPVFPEGGEAFLSVYQGPHTSGGTHDRVEAIDINSGTGHSAKATHTGVVTVGNYGNYGDFVDVTSTCEIRTGVTTQVTSRYAHLDAIFVSTGQTVTLGQVLGLTGSSGTGSPHLHYEFRPDGTIQMRPPFLPKYVEPGCRGTPICNVSIP